MNFWHKYRGDEDADLFWDRDTEWDRVKAASDMEDKWIKTREEAYWSQEQGQCKRST